MKNILFTLLASSVFLFGCIGDDIILDEVDETLSILNPIDTLGEGQTYRLEIRYTNNIGVLENPQVFWTSSDEGIISVSGDGLLFGEAKGNATITAAVELPDETLMVSAEITVDEQTVNPPPSSGTSRNGVIETTSFYTLTGSFEITETDTGIRIDIGEDYEASESLPGLYIYLGNNPNSIGNALEIQGVQVFNGAHSYEVEGVDINDYDFLLYWCKPFGVKVGDGKIE